MPIKNINRKARANYKKKVTVIRIELYGTDNDICEYIEKIKLSGGSVQGFIKSIIREKMKNSL